MDSHAADSRKLMRLKLRRVPTLSAVDQTIDSESLLLVRWMVEWLDEDLDESLVLDAGCWNTPSAA